MARTHYLQELESVRQELIQMGETTLTLLTEAMLTVSGGDSGSAERASELEAKTDHQHRVIHDECLRLIAREAPVARDARLITGILDAIVDLELIGDYAYEIVTISGATEHRLPHPITTEILEIGSKTREILSTALGGWRTEEIARDLSVRTPAAAIRAECQLLYGKLSQLMGLPGYAQPCVNLMLICRHLERISRHAACVAEQAAGAAPLSNSH